MIIRIVKMEFQPHLTGEFLKIFNGVNQHIRNQPGCMSLELLRDVDHPHRFFTYSHWDNSDSLENYRQSEFFRTTWSKTRALFSDKPKAWTTFPYTETGQQ